MAGSETGTLWIVATPIGTLADLSRRAGEVIENVDLLLAEDTRRTRRLISGLGLELRGSLRSLHEHNETKVIPDVLAALNRGDDVALVSDAGTPVLSDPGYLLVHQVRQEGLSVASVPGPSAFTAALAAAGQPPLPATLVGFLPPRQGARKRRLGGLLSFPGTLVFFLSPHRLAKELTDVAEVFGWQRPATLLAEISKRYERAETGVLGDLKDGREAAAPRGEYVLVVGPVIQKSAPSGPVTREQARRAYEQALEEVGDRREAQRVASRELNISRRDLYALIFEN